jgi:hypothetical protein
MKQTIDKHFLYFHKLFLKANYATAVYILFNKNFRKNTYIFSQNERKTVLYCKLICSFFVGISLKITFRIILSFGVSGKRNWSKTTGLNLRLTGNDSSSM